MRTIPILIALLVLTACMSAAPDDETEDVRLRAEPDTVTAGGSVILVLSNGTSGTIGYNLCTSALERRRGDGWEAVPEDRVCTLELRTLPAGEEARYTVELPAGLEPGEYRYVATVERLEAAESDRIASNTFRVT